MLRDRNHPCVVLYSLGNEVAETAQKRGIALSAQMRARILQFDDTRPVTCGVNLFFNFLSAVGLGVYSQKKAEKAARSKGRKKERAVGSAFFNKLAGMFGSGVMKRGATLFGSDVFTKKHFAQMDVAGYNYGILRYRRDVRKYPDRVILGSETFVRDAPRFMRLAAQYPAVIGDFVWAGMDYLGEVGIGAMEYADYAKNFTGGPGWLAAGSGRLDLTGRERAEALFTKVAFGLLPIAIAVVRPDRAREEHSPSAWGMTNAVASWSWDGCDGMRTKVEVYCRAYLVKLFINSRLVGCKKTRGGCRAVFHTRYFHGDVVAVGYDREGNAVARTRLSSAENMTVLTLSPESERVRSGELVYVRMQYTDGAGTLKPLARGEIVLEVSGGELLGLGSACPYNERGFLADRTDTYYGEALAVIRPCADCVRVRAHSPFGDAGCAVPVLCD